MIFFIIVNILLNVILKRGHLVVLFDKINYINVCVNYFYNVTGSLVEDNDNQD